MIRFIICMILSGALLFFFIEQANRLNELRLKVPLVEKEVKRIQRENERIAFDLAKFADPVNLFAIAARPEYAHLKFPTVEECQ